MQIGVLKEKNTSERRVAASPETVKKLVDMGLTVAIEAGAGKLSDISDKDFKNAGAVIEKDEASLLKNSDIIFKVLPPFGEIDLSKLKKGCVLVSLMEPSANKKNIEKLAENQISAFSMEMIPRISRAQSMDVLSSQSNLAGYKAVIDAVAEYGKVVPMMMTAAGTVKPAKVLVLGAGVAGLQAIATAKRLGAVVSAFDVRPVVKEQVESLGASFVEVPIEEENAETKGGYARETSKEYQEKQTALIHETLKTQNIAITTALIPGRPAPVLISEEMVKDMQPGSVIVDLAVASGGNCPLSERNKVVIKHGVKIIGYDNFPSRVAGDASLLFAKNMLNFVSILVDKESGNLNINLGDDIISGCLLTHKGKVIHPMFKGAGKAAGEKPAKKPKQKKAPPKKMMKRKPHLKQKTKTTKRPAKKSGKK